MPGSMDKRQFKRVAVVEAVRVELEEEERKGRVELCFRVFEPKSRGTKGGFL